MSVSTTKSVFWKGVREGVPFIVVAIPFSMLFGVVATEAGLNVAEVMGFSVLVIAGAAQFAALQLMQENAPTIVVLVTALAVNLRMAMYSASLTPHLGAASFWKRAVVAYFNVDQSYAMAMIEYEKNPDRPVGDKVTYYLGVVTPIAAAWYAFSLVGALVGSSIPGDIGLDFALPITFLALIGPMLKTLPHVLAAGTSILVALALSGLPYGTGLLLAGFAAMVVGAEAERRTK